MDYKIINEFRMQIIGSILLRFLLILTIIFIGVSVNVLIYKVFAKNIKHTSNSVELFLFRNRVIFTIASIFISLSLITLLINNIFFGNLIKDYIVLDEQGYIIIECETLSFDKGGKFETRTVKAKNIETGEIFKLIDNYGPIEFGDKFQVARLPNTGKTKIIKKI